MSEFNPTLKCPCDKAFLKEIFIYESPPKGETQFNIGAEKYQRAYDKCEICEHYFSRHSINMEHLYDSTYLDSTYGSVNGMKERLEKIQSLAPEKSDNYGRVKRILKFSENQFKGSDKKMRLLDVGSGIGVFPVEMKKEGWDVTGIEPDPRTSKFLRDELGITTYDNKVDELGVTKVGEFDVITFNKVLEHVEDPVEMLSAVKRFLKKTGFVYIELPDIAASIEGKGREEFFIEHHHVFSPESISKLINGAGFNVNSVTRIIEPSSKYTLIGFATLKESEIDNI